MDIYGYHQICNRSGLWSTLHDPLGNQRGKKNLSEAGDSRGVKPKDLV